MITLANILKDNNAFLLDAIREHNPVPLPTLFFPLQPLLEVVLLLCIDN